MVQSDLYYKSLVVGVTSKVGLLLTDVLQSYLSAFASAFCLSSAGARETRRLLFFRDTVKSRGYEPLYNIEQIFVGNIFKRARAHLFEHK